MLQEKLVRGVYILWRRDYSVDIALAAETGLKWMVLKNVSLELSFNPTYHLISDQLGAEYHF
jgi:hypothetical protein